MFRHCGDELVKHDPLPKQRVSASLGGVGLEMAVVTERFSGRPEQGQQGDREGVDQPQAIASVGVLTCTSPMPIPKRMSLLSRNPVLNSPPSRV